MAIICEQQNSPDFSRFFCVRLSVRPSGFLEVLRHTKWRERWLCTRNLTRLDYIGIYIGACVSFIKSKESDRVAHESWAETNRHRVECCIHQTYSSISSGNLSDPKFTQSKFLLISCRCCIPLPFVRTQHTIKVKKEKKWIPKYKSIKNRWFRLRAAWLGAALLENSTRIFSLLPFVL